MNAPLKYASVDHLMRPCRCCGETKSVFHFAVAFSDEELLSPAQLNLRESLRKMTGPHYAQSSLWIKALKRFGAVCDDCAWTLTKCPACGGASTERDIETEDGWCCSQDCADEIEARETASAYANDMGLRMGDVL